MTRRALLLLGGSGFLGRNLLREWARLDGNLEVVSASRNPGAAERIPGPRLRWVPYGAWEEHLDALLAPGTPAAVVHLAAMADHAACEKDPAAALEANCLAAVRAAQACRDRSTAFITVGTDGVFSGIPCPPEPGYWPVERSIPTPCEVYGRTKREAETRLRDLGWGHVLRLSFVGPSLGTGKGLVAYLARCLRQPGQEVRGWVDNRFTPLPTRILAEWLLALAQEAPPGHSIRHWGSAPALTKFEFLERLAREAGYQPRMIAARRAEDMGKALDQSLESDPCCGQEDLFRWASSALREELGI